MPAETVLRNIAEKTSKPLITAQAEAAHTYQEARQKHDEMTSNVSAIQQEIQILETHLADEKERREERQVQELLGETVVCPEAEIEAKINKAKERLKVATKAQDIAAERRYTSLTVLNQLRSKELDKSYKQKTKAALDLMIQAANAAADLYQLANKYKEFGIDLPHPLLPMQDYGFGFTYWEQGLRTKNTVQGTAFSELCEKARQHGYDAPEGINPERAFKINMKHTIWGAPGCVAL